QNFLRKHQPSIAFSHRCATLTCWACSYFRWHETDRLVQYGHVTVRQVLDQHFRNKKLRLLLAADCGHWGSPPCRTSFVFDSMLRLSYFLGNYYPQGGSQAFADALASCVTSHGGDILMS